jgi:phosphoribosylformylglycinamidine synthase
LDSAKGWAATIRFNERVLKQFQEFYNRPDTFSLGICNGCQLQALLGWVPATASADGGVAAQLPDLQQPRFVHNTSGRWVATCVGVGASHGAAVALATTGAACN